MLNVQDVQAQTQQIFADEQESKLNTAIKMVEKYHNRTGTREEWIKGRQILKQFADAGNRVACFYYGQSSILYASTVRDFDEACHYLLKSDDSVGKYILGKACIDISSPVISLVNYDTESGLSTIINKEPYRKMGRHYLKEAAHENVGKACFEYAKLLETEIRPETYTASSLDEIERWYKKAIAMIYPEASNRLFKFYNRCIEHYNKQVEKSEHRTTSMVEEVERWYKKAIDMKYLDDGRNRLFQLYIESAEHYYKKVVWSTHPETSMVEENRRLAEPFLAKAKALCEEMVEKKEDNAKLLSEKVSNLGNDWQKISKKSIEREQYRAAQSEKVGESSITYSFEKFNKRGTKRRQDDDLHDTDLKRHHFEATKVEKSERDCSKI